MLKLTRLHDSVGIAMSQTSPRSFSGSAFFTWIVVPIIGLAIIALHFNGLFQVPMNDYIWGISISADPIGELSNIYNFLLQSANGCIDHNTTHNYPFGALSHTSLSRYLVISYVIATTLAFMTKKIMLSYNLMIMSVVFLNYAVTYFASRQLFKDPVVALIPAVLTTFSAYAYSHYWAHFGLMPIFYFPCFLWLFCRLQEQPSNLIIAVGAAFTIAATLYSSPYYFYFECWMAVAIFFCFLGQNSRRGLLKKTVLGNGFCVAMALIFVAPFIKDTFFHDMTNAWYQKAAAHYGNNLYYLTNYSARPSDYILPNVHNAFFGDYFRPYIADANNARNWWSDEFAISIGIMPTFFMLLMVFALPMRSDKLPRRFRLLRDSLIIPFRAAMEENKALVNALMVSMVISFLLSLSPSITIFGINIPTPNEILRHVVPFRSNSRFALLFLLALSSLIALVVKETKHRNIWVSVFIAFCVFESFPKTMLYPVSSEKPYLQYLRSRPEKVIMRFERQNVLLRRIIDLEVLLTGKRTINGDVNFNYGYTEWALEPQFRNFNFGQLGQLGADLLLVNGKLNISPKESATMQLLREFPEEDIQIWKITPSNDPQLTAAFKPFIDQAQKDECYVAPKSAVQEALQVLIKAAS
jgi:hypothetical protein